MNSSSQTDVRRDYVALGLRVWRFITRHLWSLSLSLLAAFSFANLAADMVEGELSVFDERVAAWMISSRGHWDGVMLALTYFGKVVSLVVVCVVGALALLLARRRWESAYVLVCGAGVGLWCIALKLLFQRVRPGADALYVITTPGSFSFPSGHAMGTAGVLGSFVVVVFALRLALAWKILAVAIAVPVIIGVAASRVYFGVHYPSDIIGGQLAAAAWVAAVTGWFYPRLLPAEASTAS